MTPSYCLVSAALAGALSLAAPGLALAAPDAFKTHMAAGQKAEGASDWTVATAAFKDALAARPDDAEALAEYAWCAVNAGDVADVEAVGVRAVKAARTAKKPTLEAMALYDLGLVELGADAHAARSLFQASIALRPNKAVAQALAAADDRAPGTRAGDARLAALGISPAAVSSAPVPAATIQPLALDATPADGAPGAPCPTDMQCQTHDLTVAGAHVPVTETDSGDSGELDVTVGAHQYALGFLTLSEAHMSDYRQTDALAKVSAVAGTLAGGAAAAVVVADLEHRAFHDQSDVTISVSHSAKIVVCDLAKATCSAPLVATCGAGGCSATMEKGVLTVRGLARATYRVGR